MPNTTGDSCKTCFFFEKQVVFDKNLGRSEIQVCRAKAPEVMLNPDGSPVSFWPRVEATDWCGDFLTGYPQGLVWNTYDGSILAPGSGAWVNVSFVDEPNPRYAQFGKIVVFCFRFWIVDNGTGATSIVCPLPTVPANHNFAAWGSITSHGSVVPTKALAGCVSRITNTCTFTAYDGTYPGATGVDVYLAGMYRAS